MQIRIGIAQPQFAFFIAFYSVSLMIQRILRGLIAAPRRSANRYRASEAVAVNSEHSQGWWIVFMDVNPIEPPCVSRQSLTDSMRPRKEAT